MSKVLVVAAHPDDEVLGCCGTLLKRREGGDDISILILGEGITARFSNDNSVDRSNFNVLYSESKAVAKSIGVKKHTIMGFPDNKFDSVPLLDVVRAVETIKNEVGPDIVFTHFRDDLNIDHKITFDAVITACRPQSSETVREICCFETPSATEYNYTKTKFSPNLFVDIGDYVEKKIDVVSMYQSETKKYPHPRSLEYVKSLASVRGISVGVEYAEAFEIIRKIY